MRELSPGSVVAGHRIEGLVARGGMGVVYRVTHVSLERERALKLIAPELAADQDFRERFRREWRLAASIEHPHAIPIYDAGEVDELLYIAMRYVHGTDLRETISREGPLDPERAAKIVVQVASALDAAHRLGLIHRDIKPANVLLEDVDGELHSYLTDFGLSKHANSTVQLTDTGHWVGTVDYVAPEQIEGKHLDARTDIYGLGCVLFEALTGTVPYKRDNDVATIWAHMSEPPPSLAESAPDLPQVLDEVVQRAMAKDPDQRFLSAGDFGRATLAAVQGVDSVTPERSVATGEAAGKTPPPATVKRGLGARLRSRYRAPMSVGVVLALLSAIIAVGVVVQGGDGGAGDSVAVRDTLVQYQREVGRICSERNRIARSTARRARPYQRRLDNAKDLVGVRNAIVQETQHRINTATTLRSRLAGLDSPSPQVGPGQRKVVRGWDRNISRFQSYRDGLKGVRTYEDLRRAVTRFDSGQRTSIERTSTGVAAGLQRLGGQSCRLETPPTTKPSVFPPNPSNPGPGPGPNPPDPNPPRQSPAPGPDPTPSQPSPSQPNPDPRPPSGGGGGGGGGGEF